MTASAFNWISNTKKWLRDQKISTAKRNTLAFLKYNKEHLQSLFSINDSIKSDLSFFRVKNPIRRPRLLQAQSSRKGPYVDHIICGPYHIRTIFRDGLRKFCHHEAPYYRISFEKMPRVMVGRFHKIECWIPWVQKRTSLPLAKRDFYKIYFLLTNS